jgi:DNA-binding MarR family transcriptional regulator
MQRRRKNARPDWSVAHLLHRAGQCADELFARNIGSSDLTTRQYAILLAISEREGLNQLRIADATGVDRSTLSEVVRRLVRKGWLHRQRTKDDAREYAAHLTAAGQEALRAGEAAVRKTDEAVLAALPEARRAQFLEALGKVAQPDVATPKR